MNKKANSQNDKVVIKHKRLTLIASVLLAVLSWVIVAGFIAPRSSKRIERVAIDYLRGEANYKNLGLQIVTDRKDWPEYADIEITGPETVIGDLDNTAITVYPSYTQVRGPGDKELPLQYEKLTAGNYEVQSVKVRGSSDTAVTLAFEEMERKTFPVVVQADGIVAAEGFSKDDATVSPIEVEVTGPKTEMQRVVQVAAVITDGEERTESKIYPGVALTLLDAEGNAIDDANFEFNTSTVEVEIPILAEHEIDLTVDFAAVPQGFDSAWLRSKMDLSVSKLQVAGLPQAFETLDDPYVVGELALNQIQPDGSYQPFNISLPEGIRNRSQLQQVRASFDVSDMSQREFDVYNISVRGAPRNLNVTAANYVVSNVIIFGENAQMQTLLPENITVEVDASGLDASAAGQQVLPARVVVAGANRTFALGNYSVLCSIQAAS